MICFAGFICSFHFALCSAIFCVAHTADIPMASVTLAVPERAGEAGNEAPYRYVHDCNAVSCASLLFSTTTVTAC